MTFVAIAVGGAAVIGAGTSLYIAGKQGQIGNSQLSLEADQAGKQDQAFNQLQTLINNPNSFLENNSMFTQMINQGGQQVSRQMAAGGFLNSGNEATALQNYGQSQSFGAFLSQEQLLAGMSGTGFNPSTAGSAASGAFGAQGNSLNGLAGELAFLGKSGSGTGATGVNPNSASSWDNVWGSGGNTGIGAGGGGDL
jgi:hypothetical protein